MPPGNDKSGSPAMLSQCLDNKSHSIATENPISRFAEGSTLQAIAMHE